ncbi:bifunctional adenosylcobinamide kinase/adenosylcobinamide-phosphate guanylyltransferase [Facklamia miroungae]|uniref:Adenosylcobinamide kinase n=1 Tax=Facklamia miroungae TaxID=120956 RepID=A0A1G7R0R2_9LACT|nr:bifunctional adenosylcobinamide kinase/adenosylcobinamide-phosphate guanylyltransferase [Facklamia miroungae]NKZ29137.1 bifunctional adenosylcobinamide kinase/adenosylcobinamide-phosphate guanylyltransferase [Facklamia miroungae]SDG04346.1 adenosylcobinamide kinase / adenosylcobinamide-phosphate guanylyltransferase [Facklamia miroungae]
MGEIIYYTGGAKSGKSRLAQEEIYIRKHQQVAYIATQANEFLDPEIERSIEKHRLSRPSHWHTYEQAQKLDQLIKKISEDYQCVLVDCMTVWLTNLLFDSWQNLADHQEVSFDQCVNNLTGVEIQKAEEYVMQELRLFLKEAKEAKTDFIIVSNELGLGLVPEYKFSRIFRNIHGLMNQELAKQANQVYWVVSGIAVKIK